MELGEFEYDAHAAPLQTFPLGDALGAAGAKLAYVTLEVRSNNGHADYTCVYRFRVHGTEE